MFANAFSVDQANKGSDGVLSSAPSVLLKCVRYPLDLGLVQTNLRAIVSTSARPAGDPLPARASPSKSRARVAFHPLRKESEQGSPMLFRVLSTSCTPRRKRSGWGPSGGAALPPDRLGAGLGGAQPAKRMTTAFHSQNSLALVSSAHSHAAAGMRIRVPSRTRRPRPSSQIAARSRPAV